MVTTVSEVQSALNSLGYGPLDVDGISGPLTQASVRRFQQDHALSVDGNAGPITKAALTAALAVAGNPTAQALLTQDNSSPPTNVIATHMPATANSPAMTIHTISDGTGALKSAVKPFGTPTSTISQLAKLTGATPNVSAPLKVKAAAMSSTTKWGIFGSIAALVGGSLLAKHMKKGRK